MMGNILQHCPHVIGCPSRSVLPLQTVCGPLAQTEEGWFNQPCRASDQTQKLAGRLRQPGDRLDNQCARINVRICCFNNVKIHLIDTLRMWATRGIRAVSFVGAKCCRGYDNYYSTDADFSYCILYLFTVPISDESNQRQSFSHT